MPAWFRRLSIFLRSLRFMTLALLAGSAFMASAAGISLIHGIREANYFMERASASQAQLELLMLLSGRVTDYAIAVNDFPRTPQQDRGALASATSEVNAVFERLNRSVAHQVTLLKGRESRNREATEGLSVARMRAMFQNLGRQVYSVLESKQDDENKAINLRRLMDVYAIGFMPMLGQAIEHERAEAKGTEREMGDLKRNLTATATAILAGAVGLAALLYIGPVLSILRRTSQTVRGAKALSAGRFDTRLTLKGHDELTLLMASFNRMAVNLSRRDRRLVEAQAALQETVELRTAELRAANRKLEEIDQNRRRFFADVSHELRTPLTVILGEAEVTLRQSGDKLAPALRKSVETIQARARRLNRRIEDLLRVARSESGRIDLNLSRIDIGAALTEAYDDIAPLARQRSMTVNIDAGSGGLYVNGDKDWLRQVFAGLMANAIKYSATGELIAAKVRPSGKSVAVEISDRGCGIAAQELPHIFDRFFRGNNKPSSQESSHGVGLALAKWVVEEHAGSIQFESPSRLNGGHSPVDRPGVTVIVELNRIEPLAVT